VCGEEDRVMRGGKAEDSLGTAAGGNAGGDQLGGAGGRETIGPLRRLVHLREEWKPGWLERSQVVESQVAPLVTEGHEAGRDQRRLDGARVRCEQIDVAVRPDGGIRVGHRRLRSLD
jgi:hypothetical protein